MKLCFIADAGSVHTQKWANYLARNGHEVHIISFRIGGGYLAGVRLYKLPTVLPQAWVISRYINWLLWFIQVRMLVRKVKPDVIDAHYITTYGHIAVASGFHPLVLTAWGSDILIEAKASRLQRFFTKYALKRAEAVICDSELINSELLKLGVRPSKIRMIYNGTDTKKFSPQPGQGIRARLGIAGAPLVISTRNLSPVYNVEMLIRAVPLVLKQEPQAAFIILGDGEQRIRLNALADSLGISDKVRFLGFIAHDEIPDYLASSDIYVSTSLSDSTSLSLQEAMACELPPVVTDLPANREWISDGENGYLVSVNDFPAMAEKIIYLIRHSETRKSFGEAGRRIIKQRAEYETEMSKVAELYRQLVKG